MGFPAYDPTKSAVLTPERGLVPLYKAGDPGWSLEAICAELCRLAYLRHESPEEPAQRALLERAVHEAGLSDFTFLSDARCDAQGFAARTQDHAFIVYRGTQGDRWKDLLSDLLCIPRRWQGPGWVHWGFWRAESALWPQVAGWLDRHPQAEIVVTGHSLGAAMATITAARLPAALLVTFGSPRVGTRAFARGFDQGRVRRYVDCCDGVARVPPPWGFVHLRGERYIDRLGNVRAVSPNLLERLRDRILGHLAYVRRCWPVKDRVLSRTLADHAPVNYVSGVLGVRRGP
jgi:pimeloyl-ACP methyl ester carboxylesterase